MYTRVSTIAPLDSNSCGTKACLSCDSTIREGWCNWYGFWVKSIEYIRVPFVGSNCPVYALNPQLALWWDCCYLILSFDVWLLLDKNIIPHVREVLLATVDASCLNRCCNMPQCHGLREWRRAKLNNTILQLQDHIATHTMLSLKWPYSLVPP